MAQLAVDQGTGDDASGPFTTQSMKALLSQLGVRIDGPLSDFEQVTATSRIDIKNSAAVMVTAELPGFAKPGQRIDVNVSSIGKASSLRGGSLVLTALRGVDGEIYALAQGALTATGIDASAAGSSVAIGVPTAARIPSGAIVERMVDTPFEKAENLILNLRDNDFSTSSAMVAAINSKFGGDVAQAIDGTSISVRAPQDLNQRVAFMGMLENIEVTPAEPNARVVINSRTGTVVISRNVRVTATAVAQMGLIAFVGLAAPHAVRALVSTTHRWRVPLSALMGGALLLWADLLARGLLAPQELPVGLLTAVLGGGYLLLLMFRQRRDGGV